MRKFLRYFCFIPVLCLMLCWVGCQTPETTSSKPTQSKRPDFNEEDYLMDIPAVTIAAKGTTEFVAVYSKKASKAQKQAAEHFADAINKSTQAKMTVVADSTDAVELEVLIGDTNREESKELSESIDKNEYRVKMVNGKLCFVAGSDIMLQNAVNDFLKENLEFLSVCDYKKDKECAVQENFKLSKKVTDAIPKNPIYKKGDFDDSALMGLFEGKTVTATNKKDGLGSEAQMHFTDFLTVGDEIWSYYIQPLNDGASGVGLAISTDGVNFTKRANVLIPAETGWDSRFASFPGIWYDDGVFYLVYEGAGGDDSLGAIGLATSTDGINFERKGMILDATGKGIYSVNVGTPDLFKIGNTWYLSYHTFDGNTCQLCVAIGTDLENLKHHKSNPVIPTSENGPDSGTTGRRDVIYYDGWFYMTYEISTKQPYASAKWSHAFARSKDFINWETVGQIIPSTESGFGNDGPSFLILDGEVWVYYRTGVTSRYKLSLN